MAEAARFGWVIVYVPHVEAALEFYEQAFGLAATFTDPSGQYGELNTGPTALAFASEALGGSHFEGGFQPGRPDALPPNVELCLVFDDVQAAFDHAVSAGCRALAAPAVLPHGQTAGWLRDPFGTLIEIASPIG